MELMGRLANSDTKYIGMLPSASEYVSINFVDQCLRILNNKEVLNGIKGSKKKAKKTITIQISIPYIKCSKEL